MLRPLRLALLALLALLWPLAPAAQPTFLPDAPTAPEFVGAGGAAVAVPTQSPFAIFANPALLADAGVRPGLRGGTSLTPALYGVDDLMLGTGVGSIGLRTSVGGRPLHIALAGGYREANLDNLAIAAAEDPNPNAFTYDTEDRQYGGGLAIGWQGPVWVRVGGTAFAREAIEFPTGNGTDLDRDRAVTLDLGAAVTVPLIAGPAVNQFGPRLAVTFGAARQNIELQTDLFERVSGGPIPIAPGLPPAQTDRYGATADLALVRRFGTRGRLRVARLSFSGEQRTTGAGSGHYGATVTLAETLTLRGGVERIDTGLDTESRTAVGAGVSLDGLIRALGAASGNPRLLAVSDRLTLRADVARYDIGGTAEADYAGFTFGWRP